MVTDMKKNSGAKDGVEVSVPDLNNVKFLDHWKRQGKMRLHVDPIMTQSHTRLAYTHTTQSKSLSGFVSVVSASELMAYDRVIDQSGWCRLLSSNRPAL